MKENSVRPTSSSEGVQPVQMYQLSESRASPWPRKPEVFWQPACLTKGDKSHLSLVELDCQSQCQHPACQLSPALSAAPGMQLANGAVQTSPSCVLIEVNGLTPGRNPVQPLGLETAANPAGRMLAMIMAVKDPQLRKWLRGTGLFLPSVS